MFGLKDKTLLQKTHTLPGRALAMELSAVHLVLGTSMKPPFPEGLSSIQFGLGCFWGAERLFWRLPGVHTTAVGYAGGDTPNPTYEEVCSGLTNHTEAVLVVYDPDEISLQALLKTFWEAHNPTQGMRQGNDSGTQYRSAIYVNSAEDEALVQASLARYQQQLEKAGVGSITTEVKSNQTFYYAEKYHQQYLAKNPNGYCGLRGVGVSCAI